jgi:hypothetical protein
MQHMINNSMHKRMCMCACDSSSLLSRDIHIHAEHRHTYRDLNHSDGWQQPTRGSISGSTFGPWRKQLCPLK